MSKSELRAAASIGLLYVVRMLGLFMVLPVLPLVADDLAGATPFLVGVALGVYGLSQASLQIPLGLASDRFGRKPVIFGGLLVFIAGSLVAGFSNHILGIIIGRFLQGCGAVASTLLALVADVTRVEHRTKAMAIIGMSIGASFGLALILGPWLATFGGLSTVFFFTAAAGTLGLVVLALVVPDTAVRSRDPSSSVSTDRLLGVIAEPDLRRTILGIFLLHYLLMSSFLVLPVLMRATGQIDDASHHLVYFWLLLGSFLLMAPIMYLAEKPKYMKRALVGTIWLFVVANLVLADVVGLYLVLAGMTLFFMAFNLMEVLLPALVSKTARVGDRGTAMGMYSTAQFAGAFVGGSVGGLIVAVWDIHYLLYANAVVCGLWSLYASGLSKPGDYRTITCTVHDEGQWSASQVADALLSIDGVVDVAMIEQERLAYLKVDNDKYDESALASNPMLSVIGN